MALNNAHTRYTLSLKFTHTLYTAHSAHTNAHSHSCSHPAATMHVFLLVSLLRMSYHISFKHAHQGRTEITHNTLWLAHSCRLCSHTHTLFQPFSRSLIVCLSTSRHDWLHHLISHVTNHIYYTCTHSYSISIDSVPCWERETTLYVATSKATRWPLDTAKRNNGSLLLQDRGSRTG